MTGPLAGFRVVDASTGIAGPLAAMLLADFGADIVKVEPPGGESGRTNPGFAMWNRNKRGIVVDTAEARDRERLSGLLAGADVCLFGEPLDALRAAKLDPESVRASNAGLVYLHMPAFTTSAPWAGGRESAAMVEAATGVAIGQYSFEDVPVDSVYPHVLYAQAIWGATAALAALVERESSGLGQTVTVGGLHGMMMAMTAGITHAPGSERVPAVGAPGGPVPFYRTYAGSDGKWLFQASLTPAFIMAAFDELRALDVLSDPRLDGEPIAMALPENGPWVIERLREAYKTRSRDEWLQALASAGCPAGPVNDRDDWLDHPQIKAIGMRLELDDPERGAVVMPGVSLNLTETPGSVRTPAPTLAQHDDEVSSWPPREAETAAVRSAGGPLQGLRVLDLGTIIAGTYAGSLMAEMGADVVKLEAPGGDNLRAFGPTFVGFNKGKRSIAVDLRRDEGRAIFLKLAENADVVIDNYRKGVLERLRIDYAHLVQVNPEIITVSVTAYGDGGPLERDPGFDPILQAQSGMMQAQGGDSEPVFYALPVNDISSACMATLGALLALLHRIRGGGGQRVWTSLAGQSCMMQSAELVRYAGRPPARLGGPDYAGPSALDRYYRTRDGWVRIQAPADALAALQQHGLLPADVDGDDASLQDALKASLGALSAANAEAALHTAGIPAMRARSFNDLSTDALFQGEETLHLHTPEDGMALYSCGRYARFSRTEESRILYPPGLGEHTLEVLRDAGYDEEAIAELLADGTVLVGNPFVVPPVA